ncbi:MAG: DUF6445 family protein [Telluria sp.]
MYHERMLIRQPSIQVLPIAGAAPCLVIDDFLEDPEMLRDFACRHPEQFQSGRHHAYPGPELLMPQEFSTQLDAFFSQHIRRRLGARRTTNMFSRLAMVTLRPEELTPLQRLCHHDNYADGGGEIFPAMVLYLFDAPELGGTSFYAPKMTEAKIVERQEQWRDMDSASFSAAIGSPPGYMCASNPFFDLIATVPARWNRAIFYDGGLYHSAHITRPELLSSDPRKGRLTLNGFWRCRPALAGGA